MDGLSRMRHSGHTPCGSQLMTALSAVRFTFVHRVRWQRHDQPGRRDSGATCSKDACFFESKRAVQQRVSINTVRRQLDTMAHW